MNKRMPLMPLTTISSEDNNKNAQILLFGATTEALPGPATTTGTTPTPGEIPLNKLICRVTILIATSKFVSSARSPIHQECRKRINANKPCLDTNGRLFWPKINAAADDNQNQSPPAPIQVLQDFQY
jgi:hypothetical protein